MQPEDRRGGFFAEVPEGRRRIMRAIRGVDTAPEREIRSLLHSLGYRFRKNVKGMPGRPDVVFTAKRKVIFIHGCFWHSHQGCANSAVPRTRTDYWQAKLNRNAERDRENVEALRAAGWDVCVIWECELGKTAKIAELLTTFLGPPRGQLQAPSSKHKKRVRVHDRP